MTRFNTHTAPRARTGASALFFACALALTLLLSSCASSRGASSFYADNIRDFETKTLSNGIPVIVKQNHGSKIVVFRMIFEGGSSVIDENLGGIEKLTLSLMLHGSEKFIYEDIQKREYENSFSFTSSAGRDYSTAGFTCIQRDVDEALAIFTDGVFHPLFSETDYTQAVTEAENTIAQKASDPSGALGTALSKAAFSGTPYATAVSATKETLPNITLEKIESHHASLLNASRIKIVIIGDFNNDLLSDFVSRLDESFGTIEAKPFALPSIPDFAPNGENVFVANVQAGDTGYITGIFPCPKRTSGEYIPFAIASMYIDDLFFSIVREKHGAVYSIGSGVVGGKKLLGAISIYKATEKAQLKEFTYEAIDAFDEKSVADKLDQYKNKYISSIFSSSQSSSGVASSVIASLEYHGSESAYLKRAELVQKVSAKQVIAAYKKYFQPITKENAAQWIVVDGAENLSKYDF